jgi:hypothetical protein
MRALFTSPHSVLISPVKRALARHALPFWRKRRVAVCWAQAEFYINDVLRHKNTANKMIRIYRIFIAWRSS